MDDAIQSDATFKGLLGLKGKPKKVSAGDARGGQALDRPGIRAAKGEKRSPIALAALIAEALAKVTNVDQFVSPDTFKEAPSEERVDVEINITNKKQFFRHSISSFIYLQEHMAKAKDSRVPIVPGLEFRLIHIGSEGQKSIGSDLFVQDKAGVVTARPFHFRIGSFAKGGAVRVFRDMLVPADRMQELVRNGGTAALVFPKLPSPTLDTATAMLHGGVLLFIFNQEQLEWICIIDFPVTRGREALTSSAPTPPSSSLLLQSAAKTPTTLMTGKEWATDRNKPSPAWSAVAVEFTGALLRGLTRNPVLLSKLDGLYYRLAYVAIFRALNAAMDRSLRSIHRGFTEGKPMGVAQTGIDFPQQGMRDIAATLLAAASMVRDFAVRTAYAMGAQDLHLPRDINADNIGNFSFALFQLPQSRAEADEISAVMGGSGSALSVYVEQVAPDGIAWNAILMALLRDREQEKLRLGQLAVGLGQTLINAILREVQLPGGRNREHFALLCHVAVFSLESIAVSGLRLQKVDDTKIGALVHRATITAAVGDGFDPARVGALAAEFEEALREKKSDF